MKSKGFKVKKCVICGDKYIFAERICQNCFVDAWKDMLAMELKSFRERKKHGNNRRKASI